MSDPPAFKSRELGAHLGAQTDEMWVNRSWISLAAELEAQPTRAGRGGWLWLGAVSAAAALAALIWMQMPAESSPSPLADATLESTTSPMRVALADGSNVELAPNSRLVVRNDHAEHVALDLDRGRGHFEVTPNEERNFEVRAHGVVVRVVGTAFDVSALQTHDGRRVSVVVDHGIVEVRRADDPGVVHRLTAGEQWSALVDGTSDAAPAPVTSADPAPSAVPSATTAASAPRVTAKGLFQRAMGLRRAGKYRAAAAAYEQLLQRFPDDPRAGVAALELGRLRADSLGDDEGAMKAFEKAAASKSGGLREDALARQVRSLDRKGDRAGCKRAQAEYLSAFPNGVHAGVVRASCQGESTADKKPAP